MEVSTQKTGGINASVLKTIAIIGMTMDHIGNVFLHQLPLWGRCILFTPGGLTFPIMAFLLIEGYHHTSNYKKYAQRLLVFAAIALVPFAWTISPAFNVLFTLFLGLITIHLYDNMKNRVGFWVIFTGITLFTTLCDWAWIGVPMVLCYHVISNPVKRVIVPVSLSWGMILALALIQSIFDPTFMFSDVLPTLLFSFVGCTATIFLLPRYNGEKGNTPKYFFYIYYPAHLIALGLIRGFLFGQWI